MGHSLNEIASTLRKAGRGAGLDDGTADDIAHAAVRAVADGHDGFRWALEALDEPERALALVTAADLRAAGEAVDAPLSPLFPYLAEFDDAPRHGAFAVEPELWTKALALAHRTYVPASEVSRLAGAGAGTSDND